MVTHRVRTAIASAVERFGSPAVLLATVWVSDFLHSRDFGLYEDDFTFIPQAITMDLAELTKFIGSYLVHLYGHGRPLSDSLISLFSFLGWRIAGLAGIYLIGYSIVALNVFLFYSILRRRGSEFAALAGGLAFALFPADTTQPFLTHSLGLQPSLTFLLLATLAYLSGRRTAAYLLALGSLFCYETVFPVFLAVPLLTGRYDRGMARELLRHALLGGVMLTAAVVLRWIVGETRVAGLEFPAVLLTPIRHVAVGPLVTLGTYFLRPFQAIGALSTEILVLTALGLLAYFAQLNRSRAEPAVMAHAPLRQLIKGGLRSLFSDSQDSAAPIRREMQLLCSGLAMLLLAYPLTFNIRSFSISGRDTRVHLAAVIGSSLLVAGLVSLVTHFIDSKRGRRVITLLLATWLSLLLAFGLTVQGDYVRAWQAQQAFWSELVHLIPDSPEGTVILIEPAGLRDFEQIGANTWNLPRLLDQIYQFPPDWEEPPRVFRLVPGWQERIGGPDGMFSLIEQTVTAPPSLYREVFSGDAILIETTSGRLTRRTAALALDEASFPLKPESSPSHLAQSPGFLYPLLLDHLGPPELYLLDG